jgi:hypothetical protein
MVNHITSLKALTRPIEQEKLLKKARDKEKLY